MKLDLHGFRMGQPLLIALKTCSLHICCCQPPQRARELLIPAPVLRAARTDSWASRT